MNIRPLIACLLALAVTACGPSPQDVADKAAETAIKATTGKNVDVKTENGTTTTVIEAADGQKIAISGGKSVAMPVNFPKDIYVPNGAKVITAMEMPQMTAVTLQSSTSEATMTAEYLKEMKAQGWQKKMSTESQYGSMLAFEKDKRHVTVSLHQRSEGLNISLQTVADQK